MAAYNKFRQFVEDIVKGVHNLATGAITVALCATANAPVNTNTVLANLTQIAYTNFGTRTLASITAVQTAGVLNFIAADKVLSVSGGAGAAFQYIVLYNDTPTSPADPLICWYDYGSALTLADGEQLTLDFDGTNGIFSLT